MWKTWIDIVALAGCFFHDTIVRFTTYFQSVFYYIGLFLLLFLSISIKGLCGIKELLEIRCTNQNTFFFDRKSMYGLLLGPFLCLEKWPKFSLTKSNVNKVYIGAKWIEIAIDPKSKWNSWRVSIFPFSGIFVFNELQVWTLNYLSSPPQGKLVNFNEISELKLVLNFFPLYTSTTLETAIKIQYFAQHITTLCSAICGNTE